MFDCARTARLSPEERMGEIAAILAAGLLRLDQQAAQPDIASLHSVDVDAAKVSVFFSPVAQNPPNRPPVGLELSDQTRLNVPVG